MTTPVPKGGTPNTMMYAPQVQVIIATKDGAVDVSDDIVQGQVRRVMNGVSQFSCVLNNRNGKYIGVLTRMSRITVSMNKIGSWVQVFSGYLDSVPAAGFYKNTCTIRASCSLKRIQNTYWDPGLPASQQLLNQLINNQGADDAHGAQTDSGIGLIMKNVLMKVGNWAENQIHIQQIPSGFMDLALQVAETEQNPNAVNALRATLGFTTKTDGTPFVQDPVANTSSPVIGFHQPLNGKAYTMGDLTTMARAVGFSGDSVAVAAAIAWSATKGNPQTVKTVSITPTQFGAPTTEKHYGIWQLSENQLKAINISVTTAQSDSFITGKYYFGQTQGGGNFKGYPSYDDGSWNKFEAQAKTAAAAVDTDIKITDDNPNDAATVDPTAGLPGIQGQTSQPTNGAVPTAIGVTAFNIPRYDTNATQTFLLNLYGGSQAGIEADLQTISFQGQQVKVHKYAVAAFLKVDQQITALKSGYQIKSIGTYEYRTMNNGTGTGTLSWHSYGIAMDINSATNGFSDAGIGDGSHDIPQSWIDVFKANNFAWGGDWKDYMHFQWQGGGVYTGAVNTAGVDGSLINSTIKSGFDDAFQAGVFNYLYSGQADPTLSVQLTGALAPVNDESLLTTIQGLASASLRSFMSGPDGSFISFYPDYFGVSGTSPKLTIQPIEMIDFNIDINDDDLATDVFVIGGTQAGQVNPSIGLVQWLGSTGVVNIRQKPAMGFLLGIDVSTNPDYNPDAIYSRFGLRPYRAEFPLIADPAMEYLQALTTFQKKWSEQFSTSVQFTFMPELYPGMRIEIQSEKMTVFVEEVIHSFSFDAGFTTTATISSPANLGGGIEGMPLGRL